MSDRLRQAFEQASRLPDKEQEEFAAFLLAELESEAKWQALFEKSPSTLEMLAREAQAEYRAGKTEPLEDLLS